ncbi:Caspase-1 [Acromyrmex echinatior]|uniref:Caspase-1 n=1 Tax=Acromyrmex echinatior TaxID=103372 RepID=F4WZ91_ACREC|nr:Caspase-1 [Acromyrmex echinatior]
MARRNDPESGAIANSESASTSGMILARPRPTTISGHREELINPFIKAAAEDHTDADCLIVVAMSHGESGLLHSADSIYPVDALWIPFTGDQCLSLAGKPKLFFIQVAAVAVSQPISRRAAPEDLQWKLHRILLSSPRWTRPPRLLLTPDKPRLRRSVSSTYIIEIPVLLTPPRSPQRFCTHGTQTEPDCAFLEGRSINIQQNQPHSVHIREEQESDIIVSIQSHILNQYLKPT